MNRPVRWTVRALLPVLFALAACGHEARPTARVARGALHDWVAALGRIEGPGELVRLGPRVPGRLAEVRVAEGERVAAGQVLAVLENADARARLAAAEAQLARLERGGRPQEVAAAEARLTAARARRTEAERTLERSDALARQGIDSTAVLDAARRAYETAQADAVAAEREAELVRLAARDEVLAEAAAELAAARDAVRATEIVAPAAGVVLKRHLLPGETIGLGATVVPVVTMTTAGARWVRLEVSESQVGRVKVGQTVYASCDAFPGRVFAGTVRSVAPAMGRKSITDPDPRALSDTEVQEVRAELGADADVLPYQLRVDAVVETAAVADALLVPVEALELDGADRARARVQRDGVWREVTVGLGALNERFAEVTDGLVAGDEVELREPAAPATGAPLAGPPRVPRRSAGTGS